MHGGEFGILYFKLKGEQFETRKIQFNPMPIYFEPGSNHTFLSIGDDIDSIETITVEYRFKQTLNPLTWRIFTPRIYVEFISIESMEHNTQTTLCPHHKLPVAQDEEILFKQDSCFYTPKAYH